MICKNCQKKNRPDSKFCRFCGTNFFVPKQEDEERVITISVSKLVSILKNFNFNKKSLIITAIAILAVGTSVFAAPKINDYLEVNKLIKEANDLEIGGDYQKALATLSLTNDKWTFESKRQEIESFKSLNSALEKEKEGFLVEARKILQEIDSGFSRYEEIKNKLNEIQLSIESNLEEKAKLKEEEAKKAAASAAEARRRAEAEAAARAQAEAQRAGAEARERDEAAARARAEQAARESEYQRQQEEQARVDAIRLSFWNQLNTIYTNFNNNGIGYYNEAIAYYNNGYSLSAIAKFGQAEAIFNSARNDALDMQSTFYGMPESYNVALRNMISAATQCSYAVSSVMDDVVNDAPSIFTDNYATQCFNHGSAVINFLNSNY